MTREELEVLKEVLCPHDEDYSYPCISPEYLEKELEEIYLNSFSNGMVMEWIRCEDKMPEEHDTIFANLKGTQKWNNAMFEKMSEDVRIVEVFEDGTQRVFHSKTIDGKWEIEKKQPKRKVTHWMPNPELPTLNEFIKDWRWRTHG